MDTEELHNSSMEKLPEYLRKAMIALSEAITKYAKKHGKGDTAQISFDLISISAQVYSMMMMETIRRLDIALKASREKQVAG